MFDYLLFNCSRTIFCHCNNIGSPKSCDTVIACNAIILHCLQYILNYCPTLVYSYCMRSTGFPVELKWVLLKYNYVRLLRLVSWESLSHLEKGLVHKTNTCFVVFLGQFFSSLPAFLISCSFHQSRVSSILSLVKFERHWVALPTCKRHFLLLLAVSIYHTSVTALITRYTIATHQTISLV